jgi:hypothetical protein
MITISSSGLSAGLLDPREDLALTGSRYCVGGYIWQVRDAGGRALFSGPRYPSPTPPVFDGQGAPEAFETPLGGADGPVGGGVCVIGVGAVERSSAVEPFHPRNNPRVVAPCKWEVERWGDRAAMTAFQEFGERAITLRREARVVDNRVESVNTIKNTGAATVDLRWFAHPFFPLNGKLTELTELTNENANLTIAKVKPDVGLPCGKITPPVTLPENAGYEIGADGMIRMKPGYPWEKGLFQELGVPSPPQKLAFEIPHPVVGSVRVQTDYEVIRCALWANANTFSFEPFVSRVVNPGEEFLWGVSYDF